MKQKINKNRTRIIKNVTRNLTRLFWAIVCYSAVETKYRFKWLQQDITAKMAGFKNHAAMLQKELDIRHTMIAIEKQSY